jgi:TonB-linked SusC/RagA family outer membrane protein
MKKKYTRLKGAWKIPMLFLRVNLVLFLSFWSINTYAGTDYSLTAKISLDEQNKSVGSIIDKIEATTEFKFVYDVAEVDLNRKVSIQVKDSDIRTVLGILFKGTKTEYLVRNTQIILKSKKDNQSSGSTSQANPVRLTGIVHDKDGEPLPGVNILIEGKTVGTTTDLDGNFRIMVEPDFALIFSYVGFSPKRIAVSELSRFEAVEIILEQEDEALEEFVVTGYQTLSAERSTGSYGQINAEQLEQRPSSTNILDRLEGKIAGVSSSNGQVTVRGGSSINLSNDPLIVVDGFPIQDGDTQVINPEDVQSINVLKDAAAASIWGVRASNGVIVITTKKGKPNQKLKVDLSVFHQITDQIDYSDLGLLSTSDQVDLELELFDKNWFNRSYFNTYLNNSYGMSLVREALVYKLGMSPDGDVWSDAQFENYINTLRTRDNEKDWEKYLLRNPLLTTYNLSLSSGSERNTTYASILYNNNKSAAIGTADDRLMLTINDTYKFSNRLSFVGAMTLTMSNNTYNGVNPNDIRSEDAYMTLVDEFGQTIQYADKYHKWATAQREAITGVPNTYNALDDAMARDNSRRSFNIRPRVGLNYQPIDGLTFNSSFQYEKGTAEINEYESMDVSSHRIRIADYFVNDVWQIPVGTRYEYTRRQFDAWYFRNTAAFDKDFGNHKLTIFGGMDITRRYTEGINDRKYGYDKQTRAYIPVNEYAMQAREYADWRGLRGTTDFSFTNANSDDREISWFANGAYEFMGKYEFNGSFRIDQKNLFGSDPKYRYKPLWSTGLAWNISEEGFLSGVEFLDKLRLRTTLGVSGNASESSSPYSKASAILYAYGYNVYDYLDLYSPPNPQLRWEQTKIFNFGADFSIFNQRLGGTIEYYKKNSTDLLGNIALDPTNGFASAQVNYASMVNSGVEISLNAQILRGQGLNWNVSGNISYNKNEVTDFILPDQSIADISRYGKFEVGKPLYNLYSYNYAGLDETGNVLLYTSEGTTKRWEEGVEDEAELLYYGPSIAPWYGGLSNTFSYKGIDLTLNLVYKFGYVFHRDYGLGYDARSTRMYDIWADRWMEPGDELETRVPKMAYNGLNPYSGKNETQSQSSSSHRYWQYSQDHIFSGGYVRVRDIILGYTMPQHLVSRIGLTNLRFTAQVTNPFLWVANDQGMDPEFPESMAFNNLKSYTMGLRLSF